MNFKKLKLYKGLFVFVNLNLVLEIRPNKDGNTSIWFSDENYIVVEETPEQILEKNKVGRKFKKEIIFEVSELFKNKEKLSYSEIVNEIKLASKRGVNYSKVKLTQLLNDKKVEKRMTDGLMVYIQKELNHQLLNHL